MAKREKKKKIAKKRPNINRQGKEEKKEVTGAFSGFVIIFMWKTIGHWACETGRFESSVVITVCQRRITKINKNKHWLVNNGRWRKKSDTLVVFVVLVAMEIICRWNVTWNPTTGTAQETHGRQEAQRSRQQTQETLRSWPARTQPRRRAPLKLLRPWYWSSFAGVAHGWAVEPRC